MEDFEWEEQIVDYNLNSIAREHTVASIHKEMERTMIRLCLVSRKRLGLQSLPSDDDSNPEEQLDTLPTRTGKAPEQKQQQQQQQKQLVLAPPDRNTAQFLLEQSTAAADTTQPPTQLATMDDKPSWQCSTPSAPPRRTRLCRVVMLRWYVLGRHLRSAGSMNLHVPRSNGGYGDRGFCMAGPRFWNSLPFELKAPSSLISFKRKLKTYLLLQAYGPDE